MKRKPVQDFFLFLIGGALFAAGIFLFANQVMVSSGLRGMGWSRSFGGGMGSSMGGLFPFSVEHGFGLLMIPFDTGVAVLQSLVFSFRTASLWSLMTMIAMIAGGSGLSQSGFRDST
jgi:hypothetical protein